MRPRPRPTSASALRPPSRRPGPAGVALAGLGTAAAAALVLRWLVVVAHGLVEAVRAPGPARAADALALLAAATAIVLLAWLAGGVVVSLLAHLPGSVGRLAGRVRDRCAPAAARRAAGLLVGLTLGGGLAPAAHASPAPPAPGSTVSAPGTARAADPGWTPTRPSRGTTPAPDPLGPTRTPLPAEVVVHRGDTLWAIAARHLGPGATDAEVAAAWPGWYRANRGVIGDDPDVILPGQRLRAPGAGDPGDPEKR